MGSGGVLDLVKSYRSPNLVNVQKLVPLSYSKNFESWFLPLSCGGIRTKTCLFRRRVTMPKL